MTLTRSLATSIPLNLQQAPTDVVNDLPKVSRARKLSKRLSLTFRSTLTLTKQAEDVKEATKSCKEDVLKKRRSWAVSMHTLFERSTPEQRAMNKTRSKSLHQGKGGFSTSDIPQVCNTLKRSVSSSPNTPVKTAHPYGKLDQYTRLEQLGEGSYATVYKGVSRVNNMFVAMKEIRLQADEGIPFTAIREASLLKDLRHANIVTLHDIIPTKQHLVLIFEYCHTDLCMFLEERPFGLHPINAKILLFQLLRGLKYIHKKKILHRDIKPQNVLLSNRGELKLADFGLARAKSVPSHTYTHEIVTLWYRPPDVLLGSTNYNTSLDIWGVGCIFVEMISGFPLFPGVKNAHDQLSKIFKTCGTPNRSDWPVEKFTYRRDEFPDYKKRRISILSPRLLTIEHCESLAEQMLQLQPDQRISAADAMRHPYFADLPEQLHLIHNQHSIFTVKGVKMCKDHKRPDSEQKATSSPRYLV